MSSVIELVNVTKRFGRHTALDDVSLAVPAGVVFALLGENGAGKTTAIRLRFLDAAHLHQWKKEDIDLTAVK
jgi:ABC-type multidrug transport system ATPase subunit